jgi:hypothetical protein
MVSQRRRLLEPNSLLQIPTMRSSGVWRAVRIYRMTTTLLKPMVPPVDFSIEISIFAFAVERQLGVLKFDRLAEVF